VVHALLDSESAAAAYRFTIRRAIRRSTDIEVALFPRVNIEQPGLATADQHVLLRPERTASASTISVPPCMTPTALPIQNGRGEQIWRTVKQSDRSAGQRLRRFQPATALG